MANAITINISLDHNDWELDPSKAQYQSPSQSKITTSEGLEVETQTNRGGGGGRGAFVSTISDYNAQDAVLRYKLKATGTGLYSNYWNGYDVWTFGTQMTTHHSWAGSTVIPLDTWIYAEAYVGKDLSYYYNFSSTGYGNSGGFRSASGLTSQAFYDSLSSVHFKASVNDNYGIPAGFVIAEATLDRPDNAVPEPATMLLFGTGLIGLVGFSSRRKKK